MVKFYWILFPLPNAWQPKGGKMGSKIKDSFSVHNKVSSAWKQQYILYYLDWNRFRISGGWKLASFSSHESYWQHSRFHHSGKKKSKLPKSIEKYVCDISPKLITAAIKGIYSEYEEN